MIKITALILVGLISAIVFGFILLACFWLADRCAERFSKGKR